MNGKEIAKLITTLVIGFILSSAFERYKSVQKNNNSILVSNEKLEQFDNRITRLEEESRKMSDVYVTRREFTVIVDNLNNTLKRVDDNILKLTEKFYENQGKK